MRAPRRGLPARRSRGRALRGPRGRRARAGRRVESSAAPWRRSGRAVRGSAPRSARAQPALMHAAPTRASAGSTDWAVTRTVRSASEAGAPPSAAEPASITSGAKWRAVSDSASGSAPLTRHRRPTARGVAPGTSSRARASRVAACVASGMAAGRASQQTAAAPAGSRVASSAASARATTVAPHPRARPKTQITRRCSGGTRRVRRKPRLGRLEEERLDGRSGGREEAAPALGEAGARPSAGRRRAPHRPGAVRAAASRRLHASRSQRPRDCPRGRAAGSAAAARPGPRRRRPTRARARATSRAGHRARPREDRPHWPGRARRPRLRCPRGRSSSRPRAAARPPARPRRGAAAARPARGWPARARRARRARSGRRLARRWSAAAPAGGRAIGRRPHRSPPRPVTAATVTGLCHGIQQDRHADLHSHPAAPAPLDGHTSLQRFRQRAPRGRPGAQADQVSSRGRSGRARAEPQRVAGEQQLPRDQGGEDDRRHHRHRLHRGLP